MGAACSEFGLPSRLLLPLLNDAQSPSFRTSPRPLRHSLLGRVTQETPSGQGNSPVRPHRPWWEEVQGQDMELGGGGQQAGSHGRCLWLRGGPAPCSPDPPVSPGLQHRAAQPAAPRPRHHLQAQMDLALHLFVRVNLRQVGPAAETCGTGGSAGARPSPSAPPQYPSTIPSGSSQAPGGRGRRPQGQMGTQARKLSNGSWKRLDVKPNPATPVSLLSCPTDPNS